MDDYLKGCRFLPKLNNEILGERNAPYKERLSSLENLLLIMRRGHQRRLPRPVGIVLFNNSEADFVVKPDDRVTQMIAMSEVAEVEDLDITVWRSSRWRTSTPPPRGCRGGGPRRHHLEVAEVKDLDALVDTSREVVMLGWWWNAREGTHLSVTVVCV
ncbi:hypothetical protein VPH35_101116 [Triticum aestivum]